MNKLNFRRRKLIMAAYLDVKLTGSIDRSTRGIAANIAKDRAKKRTT